MSFPRVVIVACTAGSLAFGVLVYLRTQRLAEVHQELETVDEVVREIQTDAYRLAELQKAASADGMKGQEEPETYIRQVAADTNINMGQLSITKSDKGLTKGVKDFLYKMAPAEKSQRFTLGQVGNFLYKLEADSRRVKVTQLKLTPYEKVSPGQVGKDAWNFEAELTTRKKTDS
jgi:hypothetical protein